MSQESNANSTQLFFATADEKIKRYYYMVPFHQRHQFTIYDINSIQRTASVTIVTHTSNKVRSQFPIQCCTSILFPFDISLVLSVVRSRDLDCQY